MLNEEESVAALESLSTDDKNKLSKCIEEAEKQLQEIDDIRENLKELMKALGEELNLKPADLMTAAKVKYKNKRSETRNKATLIDRILDIVD